MRMISASGRLGLRGLAICILAALVAQGAGCESSPTREHLGNPFDPNSPSGGDALQVAAFASANQVLLTWAQPAGITIKEYFVYRSDDRDGPYEQLAVVQGGVRSYIYKYPGPTQTHWFKVQAFTEDGGFSLISLAVAASATLGPTVVVGDTVTTLATRFPVLTVTSTFGDSLLIGLDENYTNAWRIAQTGSGLPTVFGLDLGPAAPDSTFELHVKASAGTGESESTVMMLPVSFKPTPGLVDGSATRLARRVNDLAIDAMGVVRMRFAASEAALAGAGWVPGAAVYAGYELEDSANAQEIWGEFESDFGFTKVSSLTVRPDVLGSASFQLNLPSNRTVSTPIVAAELSAAATEMRLSENPDFTAVPWQAFTDTAQVHLSPGAGLKTVYCQFRNDWAESAILSDYCYFLSQGLTVKLLAPVTGNVIPGGATFIVRGISDPGTLTTPVDSVKVDLGDGLGFRDVVGTTSWQLIWAVPTFDQDTERVLRARAWTDTTVTATDVATITVSQLAIRILEPLPEARVVGGDALVIAGEASGMLGGAALDSVTVDIGAVHLRAVDPAAWSVTWATPTVTVDTSQDIIATVWSAGDSVARTVSVVLTP